MERRNVIQRCRGKTGQQVRLMFGQRTRNVAAGCCKRVASGPKYLSAAPVVGGRPAQISRRDRYSTQWLCCCQPAAALQHFYLHFWGFCLRRRTKKGFISTELKIATARALGKKNPSHLHKSVACKNSAQFSEPLKRCVQIVVVSSYSLEKCPTIHQRCYKSQKNWIMNLNHEFKKHMIWFTWFQIKNHIHLI